MVKDLLPQPLVSRRATPNYARLRALLSGQIRVKTRTLGLHTGQDLTPFCGGLLVALNYVWGRCENEASGALLHSISGG
jgi:hypothetical protein